MGGPKLHCTEAGCDFHIEPTATRPRWRMKIHMGMKHKTNGHAPFNGKLHGVAPAGIEADLAALNDLLRQAKALGRDERMVLANKLRASVVREQSASIIAMLDEQKAAPAQRGA